MKNLLSLFVLTFVVTSSIFGQDQVGEASYYSDKFHGKPTASQEFYDKNAMTGAHKTLPFGTVVKVTRLDNGKSVRVRINDRGPFIEGRIVEVSRAAAVKLNLINDGVTEVRLDVVKGNADSGAVTATEPAETSTPPAKKASTPKPAAKKASKKADVATTTEKKAEKKPEPKTKVKATPKKTVAKSTPAASKLSLVQSKTYDPYGIYSINLKEPKGAGYGVQVASLSSMDAAFRKVAELQAQWFDNISIKTRKV